MATGRLASASIAAAAATQLYRNTTGNAQVITLLASSQVSGSTPKLNVKITTENITTNITVTSTGTNHTLTDDYPALATQIAGEADGVDYQNNVTTSGSQVHLSIAQKETSNLMGQTWSKGYASTNTPNSHPFSKVAFGGQPQGIPVSGSTGGNYRFSDVNNFLVRASQHMYDPYYFENPNAYNQKKARGVILRNDAAQWVHVEDISKMPFSDLMKYYNCYPSAGADYFSTVKPDSDPATYGTTTQYSPSYHNRSFCYDEWTGLCFGFHSQGYSSGFWFDENNIATTSNYTSNESSNSGMWKWGTSALDGSDSQSYDTDGHGSAYGTFQDIDHGLWVGGPGRYNPYINFKYFKDFFDDNMDDKDTRSRQSSWTLDSFCTSSYYHIVSYQGSARYQRLQWVKYNPNTDKHYVCFWDPSGSHNNNPPTIGTSYPAEAGIFEVDVTKIYGRSGTPGNGRSESFATEVTAGMLTKVASVPDAVSGFMSRPVRLAASLWTSHCQDGKQYFSNDLETWAEKSSTYIPDAYIMVNANSADVKYYVAAGSKTVIYSTTSTADVYDQAATTGIIAKGAVTPYEQKSIILSDGDTIYVENEDATNAISITAMGADI